MRKAVVDVEKCGRNGEYVALRSDPVFTGNEGKLTKETLSDMIDAYLRAEADWQDAQSCMLAALEVAGFEVES